MSNLQIFNTPNSILLALGLFLQFLKFQVKKKIKRTAVSLYVIETFPPLDLSSSSLFNFRYLSYFIDLRQNSEKNDRELRGGIFVFNLELNKGDQTAMKLDFL